MSENSESLHAAQLLIADAVGEVIEHWGFRKALGRVWAILYLAGEPLPAAVLAKRLSMSAGSVSMSLTELQEWAVVRRVWRPGERRDFFEAETDFWKMVSKVVSERERFLVRGVRERLEQASGLLRGSVNSDGKGMLQRAKLLLSFAQLAEAMIERFLASRMADFTRFGQLEKNPRAPATHK